MHDLPAPLDGIGELQYYTGDVYKGSWKDGLRHGKVIEYHDAILVLLHIYVWRPRVK